jgi:DNA-binding response OmpR family regulator
MAIHPHPFGWAPARKGGAFWLFHARVGAKEDIALVKILVVDDEEAVRNFLKAFVEKKGYEVICASTGEEALREMAKKPAMVFLDIVMPDMHGLQALNRIKEISPSTPVIMVTGLAEHAIGLESLQRGASDFVTKPIDLDHLERLLSFYALPGDPEATG